jgi:hypothetical protein
MFTALPVVFSVRPINCKPPLVMLIPPFVFVIPCVPTGVVHDDGDGAVVHMSPFVHVVKPLMVTWSIPARIPPLRVIAEAVIVFAFAEAPVEKFTMPLPLIANAPTLVTVPGATKFVTPFPILPVDPVML